MLCWRKLVFLTWTQKDKKNCSKFILSVLLKGLCFVSLQRWSNAERLLAIDRLIETCEPTQVRHMMQVIEPQFQRDFISLLPKEVSAVCCLGIAWQLRFFWCQCPVLLLTEEVCIWVEFLQISQRFEAMWLYEPLLLWHWSHMLWAGQLGYETSRNVGVFLSYRFS